MDDKSLKISMIISNQNKLTFFLRTSSYINSQINISALNYKIDI